VGTVSRRRISAQRRRVLQAGPLPNPLPLSHKPRDPSCTYPLPAPRPQSFRPRLFAPPSKSSSHQPAKPIECKTPAIPAVSEDVVGRLIKMPVKPLCESAANLGERYTLFVFIAIAPRALYRYAHPEAPFACMHMPCNKASPLPRAPFPSRLALLASTSRTQYECVHPDTPSYVGTFAVR
jgi:hypothetical protein